VLALAITNPCTRSRGVLPDGVMCGGMAVSWVRTYHSVEEGEGP
jgi:hypothetical protein